MPQLHADRETARRILRAVRRVEQEPRRYERKRRRAIPGGAAVPDKILYLPLEDTTNYVLPQDLAGTAYGFEWSPHDTNLTNIDTATEYDIIDYYGSIALPGQKLQCRFNSALNAYTPIPFGQNAWQLAKTHKLIPAGGSVDGTGIFLLGSSGGIILNEIVEVSDFVNDEVFFDHAHSDEDIDGTDDAPVDIILYLSHENGGALLRVMGRACPI